MTASKDDTFFSRWSRRKVQVRQGTAPQERVEVAEPSLVTPALSPLPTLPAMHAKVPAEAAPAVRRAGAEPVQAAPPEPPPTLDDVAQLTTASDFRRFVAPGVEADVKNAALKKLFTDPHFNVMDGLDTYIDDYGKPDPLPEGWLRKMTQSSFLGLFDEDEPSEPATAGTDLRPILSAVPEIPETATPATTSLPTDEDVDLRLQPHHAAGREGAGPAAPSAGDNAGRQH